MSYKLGEIKQLTNDRYLPWRLQKAPSCPKKNGPPQAISCRTTAKLPAYRHPMISRQSLKLTAKDPEKIGHTKQNFIFQPTILRSIWVSGRVHPRKLTIPKNGGGWFSSKPFVFDCSTTQNTPRPKDFCWLRLSLPEFSTNK